MNIKGLIPSGGWVKQRLIRFMREEDGPTAVEYAVLLAMVTMSMVGALSLLGIKSKDVWLAVATAMNSVM